MDIKNIQHFFYKLNNKARRQILGTKKCELVKQRYEIAFQVYLLIFQQFLMDGENLDNDFRLSMAISAFASADAFIEASDIYERQIANKK